MVRADFANLGISMVALVCVLGAGSRLEAQMCTSMCNNCWVGTQYENSCPESWNGTSNGCDCGCQFCDPDCPTTDCNFCFSRCEICWLGTQAENNCPLAWQGTGDGCDCGCQWNDPDCQSWLVGACCSNYTPSDCVDATIREECLLFGWAFMGDDASCAASDCSSRCDHMELPCDYCWLNTLAYNQCAEEWNGTGDGCDCGCQWMDPDCFPSTGACCDPDVAAGGCFADMTTGACRIQFDSGGAFAGDGVTCPQADCAHRCDFFGQPCDYCWLETPYESNCPDSRYASGDGCDCGCQWVDPDCGGTPVGACCDPDLADAQCVRALPQDDCVNTGWAYIGDGLSCEQANCEGRCDYLGLPCEFCWYGSNTEGNCPEEWCGGDDGCDCGCQCFDRDCGSCPNGICERAEDACVCPEDCGGCCLDADCDDGAYCNGAETCGGSGICLIGSSACLSTEWCNETSDECVTAGDTDDDGDADLVDCARFQACFVVSTRDKGAGPTLQWCEEMFDRDSDGDVDLDDFAVFREHLSGPLAVK